MNQKVPAGPPWQVQLPEGWSVAPLRVLGCEVKKPNEGMAEANLLSLSYGKLKQKDIESPDGLVPASYVTYNIVEPGDVVFRFTDLQNDKRSLRSALADQAGIITSAYVTFRPQSVQPRFFAYLMRCYDQAKVFYSFGGGVRQSLTFEDVKNLPCVVSPLPMQTVIADFLDRETAQMDAMIAAQEALVGGLLERRRALIRHAVTEGVQGEPLIDSGYATLGPMPASWAVRPVRSVLKSLDSRRIPLSTTERADFGGDYPYYGASGIIDYVADYLFDESLLLVSEDGANLRMRTYPIAFPASGRYWVNNHAHVLRPVFGPVEFWAYRIDSMDLSPYITGAAQPKLTAEALMNLRITCPRDEGELQRVIDSIHDSVHRMDRMIAAAQESIELLHERRAAVIAAAVTGRLNPTTGIEVPATELEFA